MRILGVDTGWTATGLCLVEWDGVAPHVVSHFSVKTKPTAKKRRVLVVDDHVRRIRELWHGILGGVMAGESFSVVALEALSLARNAGSAARQAMAYAVAVCACEQARRPLAQMTPQEIRKRLGCKHSADKDTLHSLAACVLDLPFPGDLNEHEADAACAALACIYPQPIDIVLAASGQTYTGEALANA